MNVKLVDIVTEVEENVSFGTCELCFSVGALHKDLLVFRDNSGEELTIEMGGWDWGDYVPMYRIDNVVHFASYINSLNIQTLEGLKENFYDYYCDYDDKCDYTG